MVSGRTALRVLFFAAISALLVALGARLWDELIGLRRHQEHVIPENVERAREVADAYESELMELDRTVLPGISIRS
jgi:cob(I)alamin adenosyltransferase